MDHAQEPMGGDDDLDAALARTVRLFIAEVTNSGEGGPAPVA